jgi:hypothetical protein
MSEHIVTTYNRPARSGDYGWVADSGRQMLAFVGAVLSDGTLLVRIHGYGRCEISPEGFTPDPEAFWCVSLDSEEPEYQKLLAGVRERMALPSGDERVEAPAPTQNTSVPRG